MFAVSISVIHVILTRQDKKCITIYSFQWKILFFNFKKYIFNTQILKKWSFENKTTSHCHWHGHYFECTVVLGIRFMHLVVSSHLNNTWYMYLICIWNLKHRIKETGILFSVSISIQGYWYMYPLHIILIFLYYCLSHTQNMIQTHCSMYWYIKL